jgi:predicted RNase H-like nuclease (RuvC/YqgF family)
MVGLRAGRALVNGFAPRFKGNMPPHPAIAPIVHRHQIAGAGRAVMTKTPEDTQEMDDALKRLEGAIDRLEGRLDSLFQRLEGSRVYEKEADALRKDRARLASDLDVAKAREKELQRLADEASEALGAAISEVREALGKV